MEQLQSDIHKIIVKNKNKFISQQEVWNDLIEYELINIKDPVETKRMRDLFLDSFLTMASQYNDIKMKIYGNRYLISYVDEEKFPDIPIMNSTIPYELDNTELMINNLINSGLCLNDSIDDEGNTVLHYLVNIRDSERIEKYLDRHCPRVNIHIKNDANMTPYMNSTPYIQKIFDRYLQKIKLLELEDIKTSILSIQNQINNYNRQISIFKDELNASKSLLNKYRTEIEVGLLKVKFNLNQEKLAFYGMAIGLGIIALTIALYK
jgi:tetrahydromethanopterin S-methyltransferase subunit B